MQSRRDSHFQASVSSPKNASAPNAAADMPGASTLRRTGNAETRRHSGGEGRLPEEAATASPVFVAESLASGTAPLQQTSSMRAKLSKLTKHLSLKLDLQAMTLSCIRSAYARMSISRMILAMLLAAAIVLALCTLPIEQMLKDFVLWLKKVGPWGPFIMAAAYIPINILALPASILTLGGGYVFGLLVGFAADSIGSTAGATAAFLVGKTLCRTYVNAKLREYPQFQVITHAIAKSGFKIVLLLRLVPILPFNVMNYVLSVTPISVGSYMLASWIGMMPVTFAFVYLGTTIKDISEIGSPDATMGAKHWWLLGLGLVLTVLSTVLITRVAKDALEKAIEELESSALVDSFIASPEKPSSPQRSISQPSLHYTEAGSDDIEILHGHDGVQMSSGLSAAVKV